MRILHPYEGWVNVRHENGDLNVKPLSIDTKHHINLKSQQFFHYNEFDIVQGPFTIDDMRIRFQNNDINPSTKVWTDQKITKTNKQYPIYRLPELWMELSADAVLFFYFFF